MSNSKKLEWVLRIGITGEFLGHGFLAIQGKKEWVGWISQMLGTDADVSTTLLVMIGIIDVVVALVTLIRPVRPLLLWAAFWGFWTALVRPLVGQSVLDFVERFSNWAAPLALYLFYRSLSRNNSPS